MAERLGLRERKKLRTMETISELGTALFLRHGFDNVAIADVAVAAEVAKTTVFNYFPAKEDIALYQIRDHVDEPARVVTTKGDDETSVAALRRHFLAGLAERDPRTGLADGRPFLDYQQMVLSTPGLKLRLLEQWMRSEAALTAALAPLIGDGPGAVLPAVLAGQIITTQRVLIVRNVERLLTGATSGEVYPTALAEASLAFDLLERAEQIV
ncbi:TetR family transcriptional regulator [Actinoplanes sp. NPDC026619]|uniref:TetR family transcriptional regulator n=1 Tax=Actinoplanes sp. NPDC026619 TaxID=3155798 RepID=UPI0033CB682C